MIFLPDDATCQVKTCVTDSVPVLKPYARKKIYHFRDSSDLILEYRRKSFISHNNAADRSTLGLSTKVIWKFGGTISDKSNRSSWNVKIFCEGYIQKTEAINLSVETVSSREIRWNKGAYGYIFEGLDTAGIFLLTLDALQDYIQDDFLSLQTRNIIDYAPSINVKKLTQINDFTISGTLRNRKFTILSNGSEFKTWIYMADGLKCIFFSDLDNCIKQNYVGPVPFALVDEAISYRERCDLYRLVTLGRLADEIIKIKFR